MKLHRSRRQLYEKEIRAISSELHTTRDGTIILISDMENTHLMNLMGLFKKNRADIDDIPERYLDEIKARWLDNELLELFNEKPVSQDDDEDLF